VVESRLGEIFTSLEEQVKRFAATVGVDRDFSMKLLVERDRSAAEVTDVAATFMGPMGLSILQIVDSQETILSSGHFPASAGNSLEEKLGSMTKNPSFLYENIGSESKLTLQSRVSFAIEGLPLEAVGGLRVDNRFLLSLCPLKESILLLKTGTSYAGSITVNSISEVKDRTIIVNDKAYMVDSIALPFSGEGAPPNLLVLVEKPSAVSIRSLL